MVSAGSVNGRVTACV